jgi:hypothetical protein
MHVCVGDSGTHDDFGVAYAVHAHNQALLRGRLFPALRCRTAALTVLPGSQDLEPCGDGAGAGGLEPALAALAAAPGGLARLRGAAAAGLDALMLTDAPLLFPPGQLALAALRSGVRKARAGLRLIK